MDKLTIEQFIEKSNIIHNNKYDYSISNYVNNNTKIKIICPIHNVFEQLPRKHLSNQGCPKCYSDKMDKAKIEFIKKSNKIHDGYYNYSLVKYVNNRTKVKIICPTHDIFEQSPDNHLKGHGCPKCKSYKLKKYFSSNKNDFIKKSNIIHNNIYDYSSVEYDNIKTKVKIICLIHGKFEQSPGHHLAGCGCPRCNDSKGEKIIKNMLEAKNIKYIQQYKYINCKYINTLPFDFYLPQYNTCIEFDGEQHSNENHYFNTKNNYNEVMIRDNIKTEYCKNNNIELIRIKYNDNILDKLHLFNKKTT